MRASFIYCSLALFLFACTGPEEPTPAPPAAGENRLAAPAPDTDGVVRVLVLHYWPGTPPPPSSRPAAANRCAISFPR